MFSLEHVLSLFLSPHTFANEEDEEEEEERGREEGEER